MVVKNEDIANNNNRRRKWKNMEEQMMNELNITEEHVYMLFNGGVFTTHFIISKCNNNSCGVISAIYHIIASK